jgi:hypothetical protein
VRTLKPEAVVIALLAAPFTAAPAQHPAATALARIRAGALVRVDLAGREPFEGRLRSVTADSLLLEGPSGDRWVSLDQIGKLHERGRATKTAAIAGSIVGGLGGAAMVTFVCAIGRSDDGVIGNENQWADCAAVGGALGAAGGAVIGAGIGSLIPKWQLRFRSRL